jgi:hypothetical protein
MGLPGPSPHRERSRQAPPNSDIHFRIRYWQRPVRHHRGLPPALDPPPSLTLLSLSPTQPSKKRKAADLCGVTDHADQGGRAGEEGACDDITYRHHLYDDVEAYMPRGLIHSC